MFSLQLDTTAPVLSKVYHWTSVMLDEVRKAVSPGPRKQAIINIVENRRAHMLRGHIHAAAHALDPEYLDYDRSDCFELLLEMVDKLTPSQVRVQHALSCKHCTDACIPAFYCSRKLQQHSRSRFFLILLQLHCTEACAFQHFMCRRQLLQP